LLNFNDTIVSHIKETIFKQLKNKTMKTIKQIQKFFGSQFWNFAAPSNFGWAYSS